MTHVGVNVAFSGHAQLSQIVKSLAAPVGLGDGVILAVAHEHRELAVDLSRVQGFRISG
jgi:hypothetical protein